MGIAKLSISLTMIALFTIAILGFAINFAADNDAAVDISDDSQLTSLYSNAQSNASGINDAAEDTYQSIIDTTVEPGSDIIQSAAPFAITPFSLLGTVTNIMQVGYIKIFGSGTGFGIFLSTLSGLLVLLLGYFIVQLWKGGNP